MNSIKKIFGFLIVFVLGFYLFVNVLVIADSNGIGTVQDTYSRTIIDGATYTYTASNNGNPQKNYVLEYNPKNTQVEALAVYGTHAFGGDTLSTNIALAESKGYTVIAGVNGSPFDTSNGVTVGTLISDGRIISACDGKSSYDSFAIKSDGSMFISESNLTFKYNVGGQDITINYINKQKKEANNYVYLITSDYYTDTTTLVNSTEVVLTIDSGRASIGEQMVATVEKINNNAKRTKVEQGKVVLVGPSIAALGNLTVGSKVTFDFVNNDSAYDWEDVEQSVCGFYEILKDGNFINTGSSEVHPRTTIGYKADGTIVLFVVDGRQPGFSIGLSDLACAQYMKSLGCVAAIRMDGGGSSTMGLRLPGDSKMTTINSPSDGSERNDADGLLIVLKSDYNQTVGEETLLHAYPNKISLLENTEIAITVKATDERYNPKATPTYQMTVEGGVGTVSGTNKFVAKAGSGTGKINITSGNASTSVDVSVTDEVDELYANVNNLALSPSDVVQLSVKAYNNDNLLTCSNESFTWSCPENLGTIDEHGKFIATSSAGVSGEITITYKNVKASVKVTVGQLPKEITGFENDKCGSGSGQWRNTQAGQGSGSCSINTDLNYVKYGEKSLKINFNLAGTTGTVGTQISTGGNLTIEGTPTAIGMWVYATASAKGAWIRIQYSESGSSAAKYADFGHIDWEGWKYLEAPIEEGLNYPISVRYLVRIMAVNESERLNGVIYVDQLRAVYGFSSDDFDSPVVKNLIPSANGVTATTAQTVSCDITDTGSGVSKDNTKFYLDGTLIDNILFKDIPNGFTLSWTPSSLIPLSSGKHTIKVRAEDNYGNFTIKEWVIYVDAAMPEFKFEGNLQANMMAETSLLFTSSSSNFDEYELVLKFDPSKVEIVSATGSGGHNATVVSNENGVFKLAVTKTESSTVGGVNIVYKTLDEGEVVIEVQKFTYKNSKYTEELSQAIANLKIQSASNYDFSIFVSLVDKVDEENLLADLEDFKACLAELKKFNRDNVSNQEVLDKLEKLDACVVEYESLLESLASVNTDSSAVGALLGGK